MTDDVSDRPTAEDGDGEPEPAGLLSPRRRPLFFTLLTCGFLACMCCVGGVFLAGSIGLNRMQNLEQARETIGAPSGWQTEETSSAPWSASARLSGPADPATVSAWLTPFDAAVTEQAADGCLNTGAEPCRVEFSLDGFTVTVEYRADAGGGRATVTVD